MLERIDAEIVGKFNTMEIREDGIDTDKEGLRVPSSTWTYLINDSPDQFSRLPFLVKAATNFISGPLFTVRSVWRRVFRRKKAPV